MSNVEQYIKQLPTKLSELKTTFSGGLTVSGTDLTSIVTNTSDTAAHCADIITNTGLISGCVDAAHMVCELRTVNAETISVGAGNTDTGTIRVINASDDPRLSDVATSTARVATCVDIGNARLYCDNKTVNGTTISVNAGNKDNGCIRVCGAADDTAWTKLSALTNSQITYAGSGTKVFGMGTRDTNTVGFAPLGIGLARWDFATTSGTNMFLSTGPGNVATDPAYTGGDTATAHAPLRVCIATDDVNTANMSAKLNSIYTILNDVWDSTNHYLRTHAS